MNFIDISIIAISMTVILSGIYVNFQRKIDENDKIKIASDNTLLIFRIAVPLALIASITVYFIGAGSYTFNPTVYVGFVLVAIGVFVRWYSIYSLGRSFQVKVTIVKNQQLVTDGIYKLIRHPSYTGLLLYYLGLGLIMHNYISLLILLIGPLYAVIMRIRTEEEFLTDHFGDEYTNFCKSSNKLIPFIY